MTNRNSNFFPVKEGNSVIFYVNAGAFPLEKDTWAHMWHYAQQLQPIATDNIKEIQHNENQLPDIPIPSSPSTFVYNKTLSNIEKISRIQEFINQLQYNHTGLQFFEIKKCRPLIGLAEISKRIIENALPIKCLEAVILSIYLINEIPLNLNGLEKFTLGFKTSSKGNVHRHVVLGVYCHSSGLFGALGTSRRSDLAYKELKYKTLTDLILDYIEAFTKYLHRVKRVKIGNRIPHSNRSYESIPWNGFSLNLIKENASEWPKLIEKHSRHIRRNEMGRFVSLKNLSNLNEDFFSKSKSNSYLNLRMTHNLKSKTFGSFYDADFEDDDDDDDDEFGQYQKIVLNRTNTNISNIKKLAESNLNLNMFTRNKNEKKRRSIKV